MGIRRTTCFYFAKYLSNARYYHITRTSINSRAFQKTYSSCAYCNSIQASKVLSYRRQCHFVRTFHTSPSFFKGKSISGDEDKEVEEENEYDDDENSEMADDKALLEIEGGVGVERKVFILHPYHRKESDLTTPELQLAEARALIETLRGWKVMDERIISVQRPNQRFLLGKQQMGQLTSYIREHKNDFSAIFLNVNMLKVNQMALFQGAWRIPVYDRYTIVLQIFKEHAHTKEAKLQIALAEIPFIRNRLPSPDDDSQQSVQGTTHEVRFGGFKTRYKKITELVLSSREARIKKSITKLKEQREILRKNRQKKEYPTVAVVGYTNCGKTTLIKALTGDQQMEPRNQLFATLDVTVHAGILPNNSNVLYIDTIGFISSIPLGLIKAFSATLEDAVVADVVLHVRDASHPDREAQNMNVLKTLKHILPKEKLENMIVVNNKADLISSSIDIEKEDNSEEMHISAVTGLGLDKLRDKLQVSLFQSCDLLEKKFRVPFDGDHLSWLYREATVTNTEVSEDSNSLIVHAIISKANYERFKHQFDKKRKKS